MQVNFGKNGTKVKLTKTEKRTLRNARDLCGVIANNVNAPECRKAHDGLDETIGRFDPDPEPEENLGKK